jgi:hypothetical protein
MKKTQSAKGRKSRNKGKVGEREVAREFARLFDCDARRGQQFKGGPNSPDIETSINGVYVSVKRREALRLYPALDEAIRDAGDGDVPIVVYRKNLREWLCVVRLDDLPVLTTHLVKVTKDITS